MPATSIYAPPGGTLGTVAGDPYATPVESRGKSGGFGRRWSELTPEQQQKVKDGFQKAWGYVPNDLDNPKASYFETEYDPKPQDPANSFANDPRLAGKINYHNVNYKINGMPEWFWTDPESLKPGTGLSNSLQTFEEWNKHLMDPSPNTRSLVVSPQEQSKYLLNPGTYQGPTNYGDPNPTPAGPPSSTPLPPIDLSNDMIDMGSSGSPTAPSIPNPYLPQPTGNPTTPQTTAPNPTVNIDNAPVNPTANLSGISPQGQYNSAGGTFVNPSGGTRPQRKRSATNYFNRNWFGGKV